MPDEIVPDHVAETYDPSPASVFFAKHWRILAKWTAIVVAVGLSYEFFKPARYRVTSVILMEIKDDSGGGGLQNAASVLAGGGADPIKILAGILDSETAKRGVCRDTGMSYDNLGYVIRTDQIASQINISDVERDVKLGKKVVNSLIKTLDEQEQRTGFSTARREAANLKIARDARLKDLEDLELKIREFSKKMKTPQDPTKPGAGVSSLVAELTDLHVQLTGTDQSLRNMVEQANRLAKSGGRLPVDLNAMIAKWRGELDDSNYSLEKARITQGEGSPEVVRLKHQVEVAKKAFQTQVGNAIHIANEGLQQNIFDAVAKKSVLEAQIKYLEPILKVAPAEGVEFMQLIDRYTRATAVLNGVEARYDQEQLKADAAKVRWSILDEPYVENKPANKRYLLMGVLYTLFGFVVGCFAVKRSERVQRGQSGTSA